MDNVNNPTRDEMLDDLRARLKSTGNTNYMPVDFSLLLEAIVKIPIAKMLTCTTAADILNVADREMIETFKPHVDFRVIEVPDELTKVKGVVVGDYLDIKSIQMVLFRPQIDCKNPMEALSELKVKHADIYKATQHVTSKVKGGDSVVIHNLQGEPMTKEEIEDAPKPTDLIEIRFPCITEWHNVSGFYIPVN